jgi:hypothetical protein
MKVTLHQIPPHERKRIARIHWHSWDGTKMGVFCDVWLEPEGRVVRTKTKVGAEVHSLCRSWTPDDTLVGRGIDKVSDDGGSLCIKRTKGCCIESEQMPVDTKNMDIPEGFRQRMSSISEVGSIEQTTNYEVFRFCRRTNSR